MRRCRRPSDESRCPFGQWRAGAGETIIGTMHLPSPMLARSGPLPIYGRWSFEVKWDGFRALVSTRDGLHVRGRRPWNAAASLPELEGLPPGLILDGELIVSDQEGLPSYSAVRERLQRGDSSPAVTYLVFDLLQLDDERLLHLPYRQRRDVLESLDLGGPACRLSKRFDDGQALYDAICRLDMEGVVAKPSGGAYRPGYRGWINVENPAYRRLGAETKAGITSP